MTPPEQSASSAMKFGAVWGGYGVSHWLASIGITSWSEFAGMVASIWTLLLIADFALKKIRRRRPPPKP